MSKRVVSLVVVLFACIYSFSQSNINVYGYPFINFEENVLKIPADSSLINNFFAKIDNVCDNKQSNINILHIGGSHVQAGIFSETIRQNFDFFNKDIHSALGYIFPYRIAKTNNPASYSVYYEGKWEAERNVQRLYNVKLGVGGIAVYTTDADAQITIKINEQDKLSHVCFDKIKLLGYVENQDNWGVMPVLKVENRIIYPNYNCIDKNYFEFDLLSSESEFKVLFQQNDSVRHKFVLTGFLLENQQQGIVYHSIGVNGATVQSYLNCENFENELSLFPPDLVIFGIGINDWVDNNLTEEKFIDNYNTLINRIKHISSDCAFIFITNNDSYKRIRTRRKRSVYQVNANGLKAEKAFFELARQNNGAVWNQFAVMGGLRSMREWQEAGLAKKDKIHFTSQGYKLLGNMFFEAILSAYKVNLNM
jgi:lysophospholipase L1-like esterase